MTETLLSHPDEILEFIFSFLSFQEKIIVGSCCKRFQKILYDENYWKNQSFLLITGKGLHSKNKNLYGMRDFIEKKIKETFPQLQCRIDETNEGCMKIYRI